MDQTAPAVRVDLTVVGDRGFPLGQGRIPAELLEDYNWLVAELRRVQPAATHEDVLRYIWRKGLVALRAAVSAKSVPMVTRKRKG